MIPSISIDYAMERSKKNKKVVYPHNLTGLIWVLWIGIWLFVSIGHKSMKTDMVIGTTIIRLYRGYDTYFYYTTANLF
jgi:hypothetical protein